MNIDDLTLKQIKEINKLMGNCNNSFNPGPYVVGKKYFIRTVTMYHVGELVEIYEQELVLKNCSWVSDTGRFSEAIDKDEFDEVEPFKNDVIVGRNTIIDATEYENILPEGAK